MKKERKENKKKRGGRKKGSGTKIKELNKKWSKKKQI